MNGANYIRFAQIVVFLGVAAHLLMWAYPERSVYNSEDTWRISLAVWVVGSFVIRCLAMIFNELRGHQPVVNNYTYRTTYPDKAPDADDIRTMRNPRGHE
jgi:hypothetical protein